MIRPSASRVTIELPLCPSVNDAFASRAGGGRQIARSGSYRKWERAVEDEHGRGERLPVLAAGQYGLHIELPARMRGDLDNRTKLLSDILPPPKDRDRVGLGIVADDGLMAQLYISSCRRLDKDRARLTVVTDLLNWRGYLMDHLWSAE